MSIPIAVKYEIHEVIADMTGERWNEENEGRLRDKVQLILREQGLVHHIFSLVQGTDCHIRVVFDGEPAMP